MKFAIFCPHGARSGGPEALHQLAHTINQISPGNGYICYHDKTTTSQTYEDFKKYQFLEIDEKDINNDFVVVLPEIYPSFVSRFRQPVFYWWLSAVHCPVEDYHLLTDVALHMAQSHYAAEHVQYVFNRQSYYLSDYIHTDFFNPTPCVKKNRVVLNPVKRPDLCNTFIERNPDLDIVKLEGMSRDQVAQILRESTVFIDFGDQPGKDRIPREAMLSGCLPVVRAVGAAANLYDVRTPVGYKFVTMEEAEKIVRSIMHEYENHVNAFDNYKASIYREQQKFYEQVEQLINLCPSL